MELEYNILLLAFAFQWLRAVIDLQCSIAGSLEKQPANLVKTKDDVTNITDAIARKELGHSSSNTYEGDGFSDKLKIEKENGLPDEKGVKEEGEETEVSLFLFNCWIYE